MNLRGKFFKPVTVYTAVTGFLFMAKNSKNIAVTCAGSGWANINDLMEFQDSLKILPAKNYQKLKHSIMKYGFTAPIFVWENENKILDGHQRILAVKKMLNEGFKLDSNKLPIVAAQAADEKEAKKKILLFISQYGVTNETRLFGFLEANDLDFVGLKDDIEISGIDLIDFEEDFISQPNFEPASIDEQGRLDERKGVEITCPKCGYTFAA